MSDQYRCQMERVRPCGTPPAYSLTYTLSRDGVQFTGAYCRGCISTRADQVRAEGGEIVAVEDLAPVSAGKEG